MALRGRRSHRFKKQVAFDWSFLMADQILIIFILYYYYKINIKIFLQLLQASTMEVLPFPGQDVWTYVRTVHPESF